MDLLLESSVCNLQNVIRISGSKSETNRLLLLQALYPNIVLENSSDSDDSKVMIKALQSDEVLKDIHHAGTAMRFLTAFCTVQEGKEVILTGSSRMKERPIQILVDALRQLGALVEYEEKEGYPPLRITGKKIIKNKVSLKADVSSQYISALLLIAPKLENGLELTLEGSITSVPYIKMTLQLLNEIGVRASFEGNVIKVSHAEKIASRVITVESDWSSASYFYSVVALSAIGTEIKLSSYKQSSLQGDSILAEIYEELGVSTTFVDDSVIIKKENVSKKEINRNLNASPDIAQTIAVTCFGLGVGCHLTGLHTLKIKETDRLEALKNELGKLGASVSVTNDSLTLAPSSEINKNAHIKTYQDHRMAMAFAPLALKVPVVIEDAEVVSKSYTNFWEDLKSIGIIVNPI
ncbi:3-phosphoshikimate 1-carboxyvinyltransferase [Flavobacterium enshiense DK69]|uniref:3-phosphoshikimate 1-carboxyvinyltransferase n=1 Tax=Flavobacterium enshiense DK69 TaxID=1107311 RepID=V6S495_9FLAO|nr:3-phosphoshikimate 1-carboxyvinyltransferase [Flavobacterium enshiense]ESU21082.1 3-phosphoshikimate 1-carboxyvinyltransferase [Flavobacterium enshiense DK69]KGO95227.1 3-phosphoshikimate 1-carboxyvinyltransferase [Flavobacterium enshiense DK69]